MITVPLTPNEKDALRTLAERERRGPREQAAVIIVRELERAGYLPADPTVKAAGLSADTPETNNARA